MYFDHIIHSAHSGEKVDQVACYGLGKLLLFWAIGAHPFPYQYFVFIFQRLFAITLNSLRN